MPQEVCDWAYVRRILSKYQYTDQAIRDVTTALKNYRNLVAKLDTYVFNDGTRQELACLDGTIPVNYKGTTYNIPVCIWLLDTHPYNSPMCYVKPTADMQIKPSRHVDTNGRIYLPYLHDWKPNGSDLMGVIQVMIIVFGETPPVYSKPKLQDSTFTPPYPSQPTSYMPMPGVGSPYQTPYPPATGQQQYPPATSQYPSYSGSGYPPPSYNYSGYNNAASGGPTTNNYPPTATGYMPMPPTSVSSTVQQNSTGTISEEHIHASLLSAVEDKLKKRLREVLAQSQAEIDVLRKTQEDLNRGKSKLEDMICRLKAEQEDLERNIHTLQAKDEEMGDLLNKVDNQEEVDIDDAVVTTAPLYKQLLNTFAEENSTEDAIYYLGEALRKGVIDLDLFLKGTSPTVSSGFRQEWYRWKALAMKIKKCTGTTHPNPTIQEIQHVRHLSRKQFMLRALMLKCRQKANLPH